MSVSFLMEGDIMAINVEGYTPVISNAVFTQEVLIPSNPAIPGFNVVVYGTFTTPHPDAVYDALHARAGIVVPQGSGSLVDKLMGDLPPNLRSDLSNGHLQLAGFIKGLVDPKEPRKYLLVKFGILPQSVMDMPTNDGVEKTADWFHSALTVPQLLEAGLGHRWGVNLGYENDALPDHDDIDILLTRRVAGAGDGSFSVSNPAYDPTQVSDLLDPLYDAEKTPDGLAGLHDLSDTVLTEAQISVLNKLHRMVQAQQQPKIIVVEGPKPQSGLIILR